MIVTKTITEDLFNILIQDNQPSELELQTTNEDVISKLTNVYVVLPAYNEEKSLPNLLKRFSELKLNENVNLKICLVNDGSSDETENVAKAESNLNMTIVNHSKNMGLGQTLQTGIKEVLKYAENDDIIIVMDADDTHDITLIESMVNKIWTGADIVIASRFVKGGNDQSAPFFRRILSKGASVLFKVLLPLNRINDFTSGYRAYKTGLLQKASQYWGEALIVEPGFACMVELLLKLRHWKPNIVEIPFYLRYDRKLDKSKLKLFRTLLQYLKLGIRDFVSPPPRRM